MVWIRKGWGVGGRNTARKGFDTSPGGRGERRGVILCWKKEMDVTRQTVMSPRGVPLVLTFPLRLLPSLSGHCCLLLYFNIWSLFSISNTRAPAMTPLLKMPSIGIVFFFFFPGLRELTFTVRARLHVGYHLWKNCSFPVVVHHPGLHLFCRLLQTKYS